MKKKRPFGSFIKLIVASIGLGIPSILLAFEEHRLTLEEIMAHPDWIGLAPENPYWSDDGARVFFEQKVPVTKSYKILKKLGSYSSSNADLG